MQNSEPVTLAAGTATNPEFIRTHVVKNPRPGLYDLQIYPIQMSDAGNYGCVDTNLTVHFAELIVIGKTLDNSPHDWTIFQLFR